jgi:ribonuclease BN (tRNA processing enzyme)
MNIRFLGAHNIESKDVRPACLLIDNFLAIDAGGLTSSLTFQEQMAIKALLITHHHYDHIKDIPMLGMTFYIRNSHIHIYSLHSVYKAIEYLIKYPGKFYTDFMGKPPENPTIKFTIIEPLKPFSIENYKILAVPVKHSVPAVGYMITSPEGKKFFYTGDTGSGLQDCWQQTSPELLIIEVTAANEYTNSAKEVNHLTPNLLRDEMISFRKIKGYLPRIITVHMFPQNPEKKEIEREIKRIAAELKTSITTGYEGMEITL